MDYFKQFINSLPPILDPKEQEQLLLKYYETKDGDIREKLLEHNLRLCWRCTQDFCKRYEKQKLQEDIFSVCYEQLSRSLERYNPAEETTFAHFVLKNMKLALYRYMRNEDCYNSYLVDAVAQADNSDNEECEIFYFLCDSENFQDEVHHELLKADIINFIDGLKGSDNKKEMIKMYLGLGHSRQYTRIEIASHFHCSRETVSTSVSRYLKLVQNYVAQKYANIYPYYADKVKKSSLTFANIKERNQYILKSYYNEQGAKSIGEIAKEIGISKSCIYDVVRKQKLSETENNLQHTLKRKNPYNLEEIESIFNDHYGVNSSKILSKQELILKYNLPITSDPYSHLMNKIEGRLIEEGKYTVEEIKEIKRARNERIKEDRLAMCKEIYHSARGDEGYQYKTLVQLAREYEVALATIQSRIKFYKDYIESKNNKEDDQTEQEA